MIGYIGTTGLSTGPHLHFELHVGDKAVDPLATVTEAVVAETVDEDSSVGRFVGRIIQIESGGNARAKNPRSSAAGIGQFITSTWLRMIAMHRPDLSSSLSREEILDLRYDPALGREMLLHLTHESAGYLQARGVHLTPGRLYLAHFLGAEGAVSVLTVPSGTDLASVVGQGVIAANPFLTGMTTDDVAAWAERKMTGWRKSASGAATAPAAPAAPPPQPSESAVFKAYKAALEALVQGL